MSIAKVVHNTPAHLPIYRSNEETRYILPGHAGSKKFPVLSVADNFFLEEKSIRISVKSRKVMGNGRGDQRQPLKDMKGENKIRLLPLLLILLTFLYLVFDT